MARNFAAENVCLVAVFKCVLTRDVVMMSYIENDGDEKVRDQEVCLLSCNTESICLCTGFTGRVHDMLQQAVDIGHLSGKSDLDERALTDLKALPERGAIAVLAEFMKKDMSRIRNKSAFMNGIICRVQVAFLIPRLCQFSSFSGSIFDTWNNVKILSLGSLKTELPPLSQHAQDA